jgi:uncharacterized protein YggT (Ycf19 family)
MAAIGVDFADSFKVAAVAAFVISLCQPWASKNVVKQGLSRLKGRLLTIFQRAPPPLSLIRFPWICAYECHPVQELLLRSLVLGRCLITGLSISLLYHE